jgi:hypothetical protein
VDIEPRGGLWEEVKFLLGAGGIVGLLVAFMKYLENIGKGTAESYRERVVSLEAENKLLESKIEKLEAKVIQLTLDVKLLRSHSEHYHFPEWVKDGNQRLRHGNDAFRLHFIEAQGRELSDYIGKTDIEFHGPEIGEYYREKSLKVFESGIPSVDIDKAVINGKETYFRVQRMPIFSGNIVIGTRERVIEEVKK